MGWESDPTCGLPLQKVTKTIAIIDIVTSTVSLGSLFLVALLVIMDGPSLAESAEADRAEAPGFADFMALGPGIILLILLSLMTVSICYILLARFLLHSTMERNYEKVTLWFQVTIALLALRVIYYVVGISMSSPNIGVPSIFGFFGFVYQLYCLWVVKCYRNELKQNGESDKFSYGRFPFPIYTSEQL